MKRYELMVIVGFIALSTAAIVETIQGLRLVTMFMGIIGSLCVFGYMFLSRKSKLWKNLSREVS